MAEHAMLLIDQRGGLGLCLRFDAGHAQHAYDPCNEAFLDEGVHE
jgi:hypothetical protein